MGHRRGTQAQKSSKTAEQQAQSIQPLHHSKSPDDAVLAVLGSRAASRQLRAALQSGSQQHPLQQMVQSIPPVSPRVQTKPMFRGVSQEWGTAPSTGVVIQPKLAIGAPNDQYEQEADRVAAQVVQRLHAPAVGGAQPNQTLQRKTLPDEAEELQRKPGSSGSSMIVLQSILFQRYAATINSTTKLRRSCS